MPQHSRRVREAHANWSPHTRWGTNRGLPLSPGARMSGLPRMTIYHDYMKRWAPIPWWRKVWNYVIQARKTARRTLPIRS